MERQDFDHVISSKEKINRRMALLEKELEIRTSTIPDAGKGLFTKIPISKGTRIVEYKGTVTTWAIGIPVGYFLAFKMDMGASGMWTGLILGLTFASLFLLARFLKMTKRNT